MSTGEALPPCVESSSSPLACDKRTDTLRSRMLSVLLRFRWTCSAADVGGGESSFAVDAPERKGLGTMSGEGERWGKRRVSTVCGVA